MRALASALLLALGLWPGLAHAQTVRPIAAPPAPPTAPLVPTLDPPRDLSALAGKPVTRVSVVLEGNVWNDVEVPPVKSVKAGDVLTATLARRALDELLASGHFARGRVTARKAAGPRAPTSTPICRS